MFSSLAAPAICAERLSKCCHLYDRPADRLWQLLWGRGHRYYREFWALRERNCPQTRRSVGFFEWSELAPFEDFTGEAVRVNRTHFVPQCPSHQAVAV